MPFVDRGSHKIYFEVAGPGDAPPLLLIMGMGFSSRGWDTLPSRLAPEFRVVWFDNRGTGRSTIPRHPFTMRQMAADAAAVLDAAWIESAAVFGISMGGMIALELALRYPARVRALVLGATAAGWLRSAKPSAATLGTLVLGSLLAGLGPPSRLAKVLVSEEHLARDREGFERWLSRSEHVSRWIAAHQAAAIATHATEARLATLHVPTLVLTGTADRLVPAENSRRLASMIPGARLVELPGAGHCFPLERIDDTVRELTAFLREVVPGGAAGAGSRRAG